MIITLDVSAAMEVIMGRPYQKQIAEIVKKADWVIAPSLYTYEASNVMWKCRKFYDDKVLLKKARQALALIDEFISPESIFEEAIALACQTNHTSYDAMYLVTCRRRNATLVTLDKKLLKVAVDLRIPVAELVEV